VAVKVRDEKERDAVAEALKQQLKKKHIETGLHILRQMLAFIMRGEVYMRIIIWRSQMSDEAITAPATSCRRRRWATRPGSSGGGDSGPGGAAPTGQCRGGARD